MRRAFIEVILTQYEGVQRSLKSIASKSSEEKSIVVVFEGTFRGVLPCILGADGIQAVGYVCVGIVPIPLSSVDTAPFGPGLPPDSSLEGQARNIALGKEDQEKTLGKAEARFQEVLKNLGTRGTDRFFRDANYWLADRFVQMCAPSIEYPRSDAPTTLHFAGGLPPGLRDLVPSVHQVGYWPITPLIFTNTTSIRVS